MKERAQAVIRHCHLLWPRSLPSQIAIYFHSLPRGRWRAFESAITFLNRTDYRIVGPKEFVDSGDESRVAFVSFDDNYLDWHEALSLFADLQVQATFYLNTIPIRDMATDSDVTSYFERIAAPHGTGQSLTSEQIRQIAAAGHTIGAHGHSHYPLSSLSVEAAMREVVLSREILAGIVGTDIVHFSYPFGMRRHFSERLRVRCMAEGFVTVANAIPGMQYAQQKPDAIQRTLWNLNRPLEYNVENLRIDGRFFELVTGRAATPC